MGLWARIKVDATAYSSLANVCLVVVAVVALIVSVVQLVESQLARNIHAQQDLEAREGTLAHFLNTVTTVLHISAG